MFSNGDQLKVTLANLIFSKIRDGHQFLVFGRGLVLGGRDYTFIYIYICSEFELLGYIDVVMAPIQPSGFRSLSSPVPRLLLRQCQREALDLEGDDGTIFCLEIRQWIGSRGHLNQKPWENDNEGKSFPEIMFFHETLVFPVNVP